MIGKLHNSKDKKVIMIIQQTVNKFAIGFDMRTEKAAIQKIDNLEKTTPDIYKFLSDKKAIALVTNYFHENGSTFNELEQFTYVKQRTLYRYIKDLEYATN